MKNQGMLVRLVCVSVSMMQLIFWLHVPDNRQVDPLARIGLDLCNGSPCFIGITPGQTTWSEVTRILAMRTDAVLDSQHLYMIKNDSFDARIYFDSGGPVDIYAPQPISAAPNIVSIVLKRITITLQMIIQKFGLPCGVSLFRQQCNTYIAAIPGNTACQQYVSMLINYPKMRLSVELRSSGALPPKITEITPDMPINQIELFDPTGLQVDSKTCIVSFTDQIGSNNVPWLGFDSIRNYALHNYESDIQIRLEAARIMRNR